MKRVSVRPDELADVEISSPRQLVLGADPACAGVFHHAPRPCAAATADQPAQRVAHVYAPVCTRNGVLLCPPLGSRKGRAVLTREIAAILATVDTPYSFGGSSSMSRDPAPVSRRLAACRSALEPSEGREPTGLKPELTQVARSSRIFVVKTPSMGPIHWRSTMFTGYRQAGCLRRRI